MSNEPNGFTVIRGVQKLTHVFTDDGVEITYKKLPTAIIKTIARKHTDEKKMVVDLEPFIEEIFALACLDWKNVVMETENGVSEPCPCESQYFDSIPTILPLQKDWKAKFNRFQIAMLSAEHALVAVGVNIRPLLESPPQPETAETATEYSLNSSADQNMSLAAGTDTATVAIPTT